MKRSTQKGNSLIEFALAALLLVTIFAAVFQFGYTFMEYNKLEAAVRSGARYGSRLIYASASSSVPNSYSDPIRNMVVYGQPAGGSTPLVAGLAPSNVSIEMIFSSGVPSKVRIAIIGFQINSIFNTYTFTGKPVAEFAFIGTYAPST